jgi:hypothetical protein
MLVGHAPIEIGEVVPRPVERAILGPRRRLKNAN